MVGTGTVLSGLGFELSYTVSRLDQESGIPRFGEDRRGR